MENSVLKFLKRSDKWYIGGGKKLTWTPPFPSFLHHPGLWDNAGYYDLRVDPGFTYDILENGNPYTWKQTKREWTPACWTCAYECDDLILEEEKTLTPDDFLGIRVTLTNRTERPLTLQTVLWTAQKRNEDETLEDTQLIRRQTDHIVYKKRLVKGIRKPVTVYAGLTLQNGRSANVSFSENTGNLPYWHLTPFYEKLTSDGLLNEENTDGITLNGLLYMGIEAPHTLLPGQAKSFLCGMAMGSSAEAVENAMRRSLETDIVGVSAQNWESHFSSVPLFSCTDPWLEKYYWYRWYGLRLFTLDTQEGKMRYPAIAEGLEYFRVLITYSAQCHMLETRWMREDAIAKGRPSPHCTRPTRGATRRTGSPALKRPGRWPRSTDPLPKSRIRSSPRRSSGAVGATSPTRRWCWRRRSSRRSQPTTSAWRTIGLRRADSRPASTPRPSARRAHRPCRCA